MESFKDFLESDNLSFVVTANSLLESADATRYSIEVNYRTTADQVLSEFAKIALGYLSAGIKQHGFHVKHVYDEKPIRVIVSGRNWGDGEWAVVVSWHPHDKNFVISNGYYNKERKTVSVRESKRIGENAAELTKHVYNMLEKLKDEPDRSRPKLKPIHLKRGPK